MKTSHLLTLAVLMLLSALPMSAEDDKTAYNIIRAMEESLQGNKQAAIEYYNKEIAANPKNGYAHFGMAALRMDNSEYGEARKAVEAALKCLPKKDKQLLSRAYEMRGVLLAVEGDTIAAYADFASAISIDPTNEDAYDERGQLFCKQGRYDESDADYRRLSELAPGGETGRLGLARNAFARKDYDKAIELYSRVITLYPDHPSGYTCRAKAYLAKKDYLKATDDVCKALEIGNDEEAALILFSFPADQLTLLTTKLKGLSAKNPNTGEYEYYTALLYGQNRMYTESNEAFERAFSIDAHSIFLEHIGENYSEMGDYANALAYIERARMMDPDDGDLIARRADILGESGDIDGAIATWGEYIKKYPDNYGGYYRRGFFEDNSGRPDEALADYDMAIMLAPDYHYSYLGKGDMLEKLGRHEEALEAYRKVVELDTVPDNSSCAMYALLALGRQEEAVAFMDKVIAQDSIAPGNYYDAACFSCRLGDSHKALSYLRTAFEKGFRRFWHVRHDDDLTPLHSLPEFEALIKEFESQRLAAAPPAKDEASTGQSHEPVEIPFTPAGGVAQVNCSVNDLPLTFIFDTGASTVSLSMVEAGFMMKNGYLRPGDVVGSDLFVDANGDITEGTVVNLRQIDFGGLKLDNVRASVVRNQKAPLLLGQSVLGRLGRIEIDNQNKRLIIKPN